MAVIMLEFWPLNIYIFCPHFFRFEDIRFCAFFFPTFMTDDVINQKCVTWTMQCECSLRNQMRTCLLQRYEVMQWVFTGDSIESLNNIYSRAGVLARLTRQIDGGGVNYCIKGQEK